VVAGDTNSAAITNSGQVFMWGSCRSCIDLPSNDPTKPTLVEALSGTPIAAVALGECHCLFLTTDGLVLSCGLDLYVQPAHTLRGRASGVPLGTWVTTALTRVVVGLVCRTGTTAACWVMTCATTRERSSESHAQSHTSPAKWRRQSRPVHHKLQKKSRKVVMSAN
jgi:alpha-tubulin suppressor-like RCC1 family protein